MRHFFTLLLAVTLSSEGFAQDVPCWGETADQKLLCKEAYGIWRGDREQDVFQIPFASW